MLCSRGSFMNYIAEINAFERWLENNYLPHPSQLLWYKLMFLSSRSGWSEWITVDNRRLMAMMQQSHEKTFIRWRDALINAGLIEYQRGAKTKPSRYKVLSLTDKMTVQMTVQMPVQTPVQTPIQPPVQAPAIYKHKQKQKQEENTFLSESTKEVPFATPFDVALDEFRNMRKKIRKPLTPYAEALILKELENLAPGNRNMQASILNRSVMNCWQGVFALESKHEIVPANTNEAKRPRLFDSNKYKGESI